MCYRKNEILSGHIHNNYGITQKNDTVFSNAALLDETYKLVNIPRLFDLKIR